VKPSHLKSAGVLQPMSIPCGSGMTLV
jgi:hypothetical protein